METGDNTKTLVSLRDYLEHKIEAHSQLNEARFKSIEESTSRARDLMEIRLANMNEFRESLRDQTSRFVPGDRLDAIIENIGDRIARAEEMIQTQATRLVTQDRYELQHSILVDRVNKLEKASIISESTTATLKIILGALVAVLVAVVIGLVTGDLRLGRIP